MIKAIGTNGEEYECCGGGHELMLCWKSVDTFVHMGKGNTMFLESGTGMKAEVTIRQNGFIGAHFQFEQQTFDMYFKDMPSLMAKFSIYVVDGHDNPITRVASME